MIAVALLLAQAGLPAPVPGKPAVNAEDTYEVRCVACHGVDGKGRTKRGLKLKAPDFTSKTWSKRTSDDKIASAIADGVPNTKMPAFRNKLSPEEIRSLVPYVRSFAASPSR